MGETYTANLGLIKPNKDENTPIDVTQLNTNMDVLDIASRVQTVNAGVVPPANELWDGKIVREKGNGKVWIAEKQANGSFLRRWLAFPWQASSGATGFGASNNTWEEAIINNYIDTQSINAPSSTLTGGRRLTVPITGWYMVTMQSIFDPAGSTAGIRAIAPGINASTSNAFQAIGQERKSQISTNGTYVRSTYQGKMSAGTNVSMFCYQNSGQSSLGADVNVTVTLLFPDPSAQ